MKEKNIGINAILNLIRQALSIIFPLVTYPYALRVLGADNIGKVSYVQSIVSYFALIASLGIATYLTREGAGIRYKKREFYELISEVYTINVIFTILSYVLLGVAICNIDKLQIYRELFVIQSISIALTTFGIEWMNAIYEDFLRLTIRSICTYCVTIILLFLFVKDKEDYVVYASLTVVTNAIICVSNRIAYKNKVNLKIKLECNLKKHLPPLLVMFSNSVAVTINTNFDMTMLGWSQGTYYTGLYSFSVKIFTVIRSLFGAIYAVSIPRLSYYYGNNKITEYKKLNTDIWRVLILVIIPASIGLICIAKPLVYLMGGEELMPAVMSLQILAATLICTSLGGIVMNSMNISLKREKDNLIITLLSAGLNIVLNAIFIPKFSHNAAAFTTLISELFMMLLALRKFKRISDYLEVKKVLKTIPYAIVGALIIVVETKVVFRVISNMFFQLIMIFGGSVTSYLIFLILFKEEYTFLILQKLKSKLCRII